MDKTARDVRVNYYNLHIDKYVLLGEYSWCHINVVDGISQLKSTKLYKIRKEIYEHMQLER